MSFELPVPLVPWLRERHWLAVDCAAAGFLLVALVGGALDRTPVFAVPTWLTVAAAVVAAALVAVRRLWPVPVLAAGLAANALLAALAVGGDPAVVVALSLYTATVTRPPRTSLVLLAAALTVSIPAEAVALLAGHPRPEAQAGTALILLSVLALTTAWALGAAARMRRLYAVRTTEQLTQQAVADERLRIARELHDVITHHMTLITVKASVASYLPDSRPEDVRAALAVIEATGRDALAELRRMLGVLRSDRVTAADEHLAPAPSLAGLPALAAGAAQAGVNVELDVDCGRELPAGIGLSAYRIVQEALTNVVKHAAPATCRVRVRIEDGELAVEVTDDGQHRRGVPPQAGGHGIPGMRERAALLGGQLEAQPMPHRGFRVAVRLPLAGAS